MFKLLLLLILCSYSSLSFGLEEEEIVRESRQPLRLLRIEEEMILAKEGLSFFGLLSTRSSPMQRNQAVPSLDGRCKFVYSALICSALFIGVPLTILLTLRMILGG